MRNIIITDNLDRYTLINEIGEFYLAKDNLYKGKKGNLVIVYEYDGGYQYYGVYLDDLLVVDTHPYTKNFDLEKIIGKENTK